MPWAQEGRQAQVARQPATICNINTAVRHSQHTFKSTRSGWQLTSRGERAQYLGCCRRGGRCRRCGRGGRRRRCGSLPQCRDTYSGKTQSAHFPEHTLRLADKNTGGKSTAPWVLPARGEVPSVQEGREAQAVQQPATVCTIHTAARHSQSASQSTRSGW